MEFLDHDWPFSNRKFFLRGYLNTVFRLSFRIQIILIYLNSRPKVPAMNKFNVITSYTNGHASFRADEVSVLLRYNEALPLRRKDAS